ncbi:MAG: hypothetical protein ACPGUV_01210 [Polyangiales bacterium]
MLALLFVFGALAGGAVTYGVMRRRTMPLLQGGPAMWQAQRMQALAHHLDLRPAQRRRSATILRQSRHERRRLLQHTMRQCGAPLRAHRRTVARQIRGVLNAEQAVRFDALRRRRRGRLGR